MTMHKHMPNGKKSTADAAMLKFCKHDVGRTDMSFSQMACIATVVGSVVHATHNSFCSKTCILMMHAFMLVAGLV